MNTLETEVMRFKEWACTEAHQDSEWETHFPFWENLLGAVRHALMSPPLDSDSIDDILFVLARDNECERLKELLSDFPQIGIELAHAGIFHSEDDARWQLADFLGTQSGEGSLALLGKYLQDSHEYVRRRALGSLAQLDSVRAEEVALDWLGSSGEYSRLAAIKALHSLSSKHLPDALDKLRNDPSSIVRDAVAGISGAV